MVNIFWNSELQHFFWGGDSNYVSIYPIIGKEESNQFVFANGMNYFTRYLKICEVKI